MDSSRTGTDPTSRLVALPVGVARWSARHPWRAVAGWLLLVAAAVVLLLTVSTRQTDDADYRIGESGRADAMLAASAPDDPVTESVLVTARDGRLDQQQATALVGDLDRRLRGVSGVSGASEPVWSPRGRAALVTVTLAPGTEDVSGVENAVAAVQREHPALRVGQAGDVSLDEGINEQIAADLGSAEGISLPVTLVLMLLAFGAVVAAGVPVLLALSSVVVTIGITAPLSHLVHAEPSVTSMIVLIGMAVGVDYSLFYLKRARRERLAGRSVVDAVEIAAATSGHTVVVSGIAVVASLAGLYVIGGATFTSLATGSIIVVVTAVLGSITVLPALMILLGQRIDGLRVPLLSRVGGRLGAGRVSGALLGPVVRRPLAALLAAVAVLGALALPALGMRLHAGTLATLPDSIPAVSTLQRIGREFPGERATADVAVQAPAGEQDAVLAAMGRLRDRAVEAGLARPGGPEPRASADGRTTTLRLLTPYDGSDPRADQVVRTLRTDLVPQTVDGVAGAEVAVGGQVAMQVDKADHESRWLPVVVGLVLLLTFVVMARSFGSVVVGVVSTLLSVLSIGAAFGLLTLVFQDGHGQRLLGFDSPGFVIDWVPPFVLVVLVGLSMDYHVFVLARVRELHRGGMPAVDAVARGVRESAGVVTSAAAVMVSVFAIFATLSLLEMKMIGVGLATAVFLDATVVRLVALPAVLTLLGERAWGMPQETSTPSAAPAADLVGSAH